MPEHIAASTPAQQRPAPHHGERAADLIYDTQAAEARAFDRSRNPGEGIWIYPACYDDFYLVRRRAASLTEGWGIPFRVGLFGAREAGAVTPSVAVAEPGYYAFTLEDPRPHVVIMPSAEEIAKRRQCAHQWVTIRPATPGPNGWAMRCKACGGVRDISAEARAEAEAEYQARTPSDEAEEECER